MIAPSSSEPGGPLITVDELASQLESDRPPVLLDVRWRLGGPPGDEIYLAGHLPGARRVDLDTELAAPPGRNGRHPLPDSLVFERAMRDAGLHVGSDAVVYDDADSTAGARLWWLLRYHGHRPVRVLDGGYRAWAAAGRPLRTGAPAPTAPGDFVAKPGGLPVVDHDGAAFIAASGILLDARAPARYRGEAEPVDRVAGHIPGAINAPASGNVGPDGRFLAPARLRERYTALGVLATSDVAPTPGGTPAIGAYCGSGVAAAQTILALELAGVRAALYVGSWSAWIADPARPVATGPDPGSGDSPGPGSP